MSKFIIRRLLGLIPTLFIIITISFFVIRVAPGGPFSAERKVSPEVLRNLEAKYNLDDPLMKQYADYLWNVVQFDLGPSFVYKDFDVNFYIGQGLPNSMIVGGLAVAVALVLGLIAGIISALRQNSVYDYAAMSVAVIGISVPLFVIGPALMYVFAVQLGWLPVAGWIDRLGPVALIMPVATLALPPFAYIARLSRASVLEILRSDYVRTARAKGLSTPVVVFKHVLKGSMLPVVSYLGPALAATLTGSVVVEQIFRIPGLGRHFINSAFNRDYTM
ncbi:MAG TPA: ABC transporter permease subunit, partial [Spirochaetia bacterium]|nr:ABC transporter permease subunit [Spirochaetia bacterium]